MFGSATDKSTDKQSKISDSFKPVKRGILPKEEKASIDKKLQDFVISSLVPTSTVENEAFKNFCEALESRYTPPCTKTLTKQLGLEFDKMKSDLHDDIKEVSHVAIAHDSWTSVATDSYETVTIHYVKEVNGQWVLKSKVLETKRIPGVHTAEAISNYLADVKKRWGLPDLIAVSDNAAVEKKTFSLLQWEWIGCMGHLINLLVRAVLNDKGRIKTIISKGRNLVSYFHKSPQATNFLREKQVALLPKDKQHELINDVVTRWNSTVQMLDRLSEQMAPIHALANDENLKGKIKDLKSLLYNTEEQLIVEGIVSILKPFKIASEKLCAVKKPTLSLVMPMVEVLKSAIAVKPLDIPSTNHDDDSDMNDVEQVETETERAHKVIEKLKAGMRNLIDDKLKITDIHEKASILDPRTKGWICMKKGEDYVKETLLQMMKEGGVLAQKKIKQEADNTAEPQVEIKQEPGLPSLPSMPTEYESPEPGSKRCKLDDDGDDDDDFLAVLIVKVEEAKPDQTEARMKQEIELYLHDNDTSVQQLVKKGSLAWWSSKANMYPNIAALAKKYLCTPATSVEPERVWSLAGNILTKKRSCLKPENLDMLIFLHHNSK